MSDPLSATCWDCNSPDVLDDSYHCARCMMIGALEREVDEGALVAAFTFPA